MLERETTIMILLNGGRIGFLSSDIQNLQSKFLNNIMRQIGQH